MMRISGWMTFVAVALLAPGISPLAAEPTEAELRACLARNVPRADDLRSLRMTSVDRAGQERETEMLIFSRQGDNGDRRVLLHFTAPDEVEGSGVLISERNGVPELHLHTPELGDARKLDSSDWSQMLIGTDLSYEDFLRLQGVLLSPVTSIEKAELAGRPVYRVKMKPEEGSSAYEQVQAVIDRERCVVLQMGLYEKGGKLRKSATADPEAVLLVGNYWVPHDMTVRDVRDQTRTGIELVSAVPSVAIPDEILDEKDFAQYKPDVDFGMEGGVGAEIKVNLVGAP